MAQLYEKSDGERWDRREIAGATCLGSGCGEFEDYDDKSLRRSMALLFPTRSNARRADWLLIPHRSATVWVNDTQLESGIRKLADRDAIRLPGNRELYFSKEELPRIEPFPELDGVYCPRCKLAVVPGSNAVCCPNCAVWHHEAATDERLCWSFAATCALCDQATEIDGARFRWTPEEL